MKMTKISTYISAVLMVLMLCGIAAIPTYAGVNTTQTPIANQDGVLNEASWYSTDINVKCVDGKLVIPGTSSTDETKLVSKIAAQVTEVEQMVQAKADFRVTSLPEGEQFVLGFGFSSVEPMMGETGNVEIIFENENGIMVTVIAYSEEGMKTLMGRKQCGASLNSNIAFDAAISSTGMLTVVINSNKLCEEQLPVTGEGRFGILQTGSCGAEFTSLTVDYNVYEKPENKNIEEDFEDGEFDADALVCRTIKGNTKEIYPASLAIEEYKGNKVLMFRNTGLSYFGTLYKYSNFEVSFDIPYYQHGVEYNEYKEVQLVNCVTPGISFGEENPKPTGESYINATDMILFNINNSNSHMKKLFNVQFADIGYPGLSGDLEENLGYSVKMTMIDGILTYQVKPLSGGTYKTVVEQKYNDYQAGYIYIWAPADANFAIDNFKLTNLDNNANVVEGKYKSSIIKKQDYVPTEEEGKLVFREAETSKEETKNELSMEKIFFICCAGSAAVLVTVTLVVILTLRKKQKGLGVKDESK